MPWPFVGRTEELDRIHRMLTEPRPGPLMLLGEPGVGRSRLLTEALARPSLSPGESVLRLEPAGPAPFAALAGLLPDGFRPTTAPHGRDIETAAAGLADRFTGRRLVVAVDDAHRADHQTMLVLRHLRRAHGAALLVTATGGLSQGPDPLDCLRYEQDTCTLRLPVLSADEMAKILTAVLGGPVRGATTAALHAATGGNPGLLHGFLVDGGMTERLVWHDGMYQIQAWQELPGIRPGSLAGAGQLVGAVEEAWQELALDRTDELCRLAYWQGLAGSVASVWAAVLLLRGRPADGLLVLDAETRATRTDRAGTPITHAATEPDHLPYAEHPRTTVTRALLVALGLRRVDEAEALLLDAAGRDARHRERLLACRAWLLAVTGSVTKAAAACASMNPGEDREAAVFQRAALAAVAMAAERTHEAVAHLRRALATAHALRAELPWFVPYLTACLIDGLLLAGRLREATAEAAEFHAGQRGCGWNVAVAFDTLLATHRGDATRRVMISGHP